MDGLTSAPDSGDPRTVSALFERESRQSTTATLVSSVTSLWPWKN